MPASAGSDAAPAAAAAAALAAGPAPAPAPPAAAAQEPLFPLPSVLLPVWYAIDAVPLPLSTFAVVAGGLWAMQAVGGVAAPGVGGTLLAGLLLFSRAFVPDAMRAAMEGRPVGERLRGLAGFIAGALFYAGVVGPRAYPGSRWGAIFLEVIAKTELWLPALGVRDPQAAVDSFVHALGTAGVALTIAAVLFPAPREPAPAVPADKPAVVPPPPPPTTLVGPNKRAKA